MPVALNVRRLLFALLAWTALGAAATPPSPPIRWQFGPRTLALSGVGVLPLPPGMVFANRAETQRFLEATGNPPAGDEIAVAAPANLDWFLVFSFDAFEKLGVKKPKPTVAEIVEALKHGNSATNAARAKAGRETLDLLGWRDKPVYDAKTGRLEWSLNTQESGGRRNANGYWLLLTRRGVLVVELVTEEPRYAAARQSADTLLQSLAVSEQEAYDNPEDTDYTTAVFAVFAALLPAVGFIGLFVWERRKKRRRQTEQA